ncbi:hemagglutinin repeat-containing protein [Pantoea sp. DY-15]|uniref:hemagglutinin repeat-containing protein n=1 Tax=Pantoea sp. DY-15 TaxID=2871489 RepID=UPI001C98417E|nr:hemagglutinin repeat-containing protein [Pantoea sp. DY-15]MBY4890744.1 hemagglutinin repeat-containing protein [Pantoea sp. DY-15]
MDDRQPVSLARRALSYLICYLVAVQPMLPAVAAQITPVTPGTKMDAAGNGVPVVNIATPNGAGISHNQYQQYSVGKEGLILNNATGQLNQTQLGGLIQNNPNLKAGHEAQAIINEVVGANRSQLQGYTEVAGRAANVMVANPYGITCNGCGFINTPNVTLTTGKPQLDASGNLAALEVTKGSVIVEGQGLDGSNADAVSIVARATEINAGIHAKDLSVTLGANRVGADGSVTPIAGEGSAPSVAVDTGALGGMYANRIHLVSSEQGVGVNLGNLAAKQGDIQLDANGKLTLGNSLSSGALTVKGASVALNGDNKATGDVNVSAQQDIALGKGSLVSDRGISIKSGGKAGLSSAMLTAGQDLTLQSQTLDIDGRSQIGASGNIALTTQGSATIAGEVTAGNTLNVNAASLANGGNLAGKNALNAQASSLNNIGKMVATTLSITGNTFDNSGEILAGDRGDIITDKLNQSGTLNAQGDLNIHATGAVTNQNSISGNHSLIVSSLSLDNSGTLNSPELSLKSSHITNRGLIQGEKSLILYSSGLDNLVGASLTTSGDFSLNIPQLFNAGLITTDSALDITADQLTNSGEINAQSINSHLHSLENASGHLLAKDALVLSGSDFHNSGVLDAGELSLNSDTLDNQGTLQADTRLSVGVNHISNAGTLTSGNELSILGDILSNSGSLNGHALTLNLRQEMENSSSGRLVSDNYLTFNAPVLKNFGLFAASDLYLTADTLTNSGTLQGTQSAALAGMSFSNLQNGQVLSGGQLMLQHSALSNAGLIQGDTLGVTADNWDNAGNALAQSSVKATVTGSVTNHGNILGQQSVTLQSASAVNSGNLLARVLTLRSDLQNSGLIQASSDLNWQGESFTNTDSGKTLAGNTLSLKGATLENEGALQGNDVALSAESLTNAGEIQAREGLTAALTGKLDSTATIVSQGVMTVNADQVDTQGKLAAGNLTLSTGTLYNNGILQGNDALTLTTPILINSNLGHIITQSDLSLSPDRLENDGAIQADGAFTLSGNDLLNNGSIQADSLKFRLSHSLDNRGSLFASHQADLSGAQINNAGDVGSDALTLAGTAFTNSGRIQAQAAADISVNNITNSAGGKLLSGEGMSLNISSLQNDGVVQGGSLKMTSDHVSNQGTLYGLNGLTARFSTELLNSGTAQSNGVLDLMADGITNSGRIAGTTLSITGSRLTNSGLWQGEKGLSLTADTLSTLGGSRTLSGGALSLLTGQLATAGTWQSTQADITADDWQNTGTFLSLGSLTGSISHSLTSSGDISSLGALFISAETLKNQGQILSAADVTLNGQSLNNQGILQGQTLELNQTSVNNAGTLTGVNGLAMSSSTLPLMRARVAAVSPPKELINTGSLLTNGTLTLGADSITNSGTLQGHDVSIDARQLINNGTLKSADSLQVVLSDSLSSQTGSKIIALGSALLQAPVLQNQGEWSAKSLILQGDTLTNAGTMSGVNSLNLALSGDVLQQTGGALLTGGELLLNAADVRNDGNMQGNTLSLSAGNLTNNGLLQGDSDASLKLTGQVINNASGRVISGKTLTVVTPSLMNYGLIQSASDSNLTSQTQIRNDGRLLSGATLTAIAPQYTGSGLVQASTLLFQVANATNNGTLLADNGTLSGTSMLNQGTAQAGDLAVNYDQLNNTGTVLGTNRLNVKASQVIQNTSGKLFSGGDLQLISGGVDASGQLVALKNLTLQLNNAFTGKAVIAAGSALNISSNGAIDNQSTMQGNAVTISAGAQLTNSGQISIGNGSSALSGRSVLMNGSGSLQAGGDVALTSLGDLTLNGFAGTLGNLTLSAPGTIVNTALLYAANNLALYANIISNQRGDMLAGNNLQLQRDAAGNANSEVINTSGSIETQNGDIVIKTGHLLNTRDGLNVQQSTTQNTSIAGLGNATLKLPYSQMADGTWGYYSRTGTHQVGPCNGHGACSYNKVTNYYYAPFADYVTQKFASSQTEVNVVASGGAARIASGRNLTLQAGTLDNQASNILANQNIFLSGSQLNNQSWQAGTNYDYLLYQYAYESTDGTPPVATLNADTVVPTKPKSNTVFFKLTGHETDFTPGELYRSVIQAGGNISASFASDISNSTISANAGRVSNTIATPSLNRISNRAIGGETQKQGLNDFTPVAVNSPAWRDQLQDALQQVNGGDALDSGAQNSESLSTVTVNHAAPTDLGKLTSLNGAGISSAALKQTTTGQPVTYQRHSVDTSAYPIPSGNNGYFVVSDDKNSPYLITLNPKLDGLGKLDPALFSDLNRLLGNQPAVAPQETRSQYTDVSQFLGSSYLLGRLNLKPDQDYRFLGDAAFDTRYVSNAILNETGSRYLNGVGSDLQQMQVLMDNAAAAQRSLGLQFGVSLSADQVAGLDHSILWWESTTINGEQVMVPKLYLVLNDVTLNSGSVIAANNVDMQGNTVSNDGSTLQAGNALTLSSQNSVANLNQALIKAGGDLSLSASGDISNVSSTISGKAVALESMDGSISNITQADRFSLDTGGKSGRVSLQQTSLGNTASISADISLSLNAGKDITLSGSKLTAGNDLLMNAWGNIAVNANQVNDNSSSTGFRGQTNTTSSVVHSQGSIIDAGGSLNIQAGKDLSLTASNVHSGADTTLAAGHDLDLNSMATLDNNSKGTRETHASGSDRTSISSGGNLTLTAGQDITSQAAALDAGGDASLQAGRDINLNAEASASGNSEHGSNKIIINETVRQQGTEITSKGNTSLAAGRDITSHASDISTDQDLAMKAGRDVNITTSTESDYAYREETKTKKGFLKKTSTHTIQENSTAREKTSQLSGNTVSVIAGNDLTVQGSSVAGDKGVALSAGHDLNIVTATNTESTYSLKEVKKSGLMGGGLGLSYGKQSAKSERNGEQVTQSDARSLVGAGNGAVTLTAGNNALIKGSDVVAGGQNGDISVTAKNIAIVAGQDQVRETEKQESKSSGFGLSLNLGPLDTVRNLRDIMNNTSSVYDQVKQVGNEFGASALDSPAPGLTYGRSASKGSQNIESVYQSGSALNASGNLTLKALGDADTSTGHILVEGSSLNAGGKAALDATRNIDITSAADSQKAASSSSSKNWSATTSASIGALARSGGGSPNNGSAGTNYGSKNSQMSGDSSILTQHTSSITAGSVDVTSHTGDIGITGSTLTGTTGVALNAEQGNVSVVAGEDRQQTSASGSDHAIGDLGGDGYSGTVGVGHNSWKNASTGTQQNTVRSGIVSTLGDVTVNAAKDVNLQGADVFAGDSLSVNGENIHLDPAKDTHKASSSSESTKYGITGSVSGYAVSIAQAVDKAREANRNHDDPRLQAIYAAQAAMTALSSSAQSNAAIKVSVSATAGSSHQSQTQSSTQENGTVLGALNNVDLNAERDITAQGVKITGNNVSLAAGGDVKLNSATDTSSMKSSSGGSQYGVGVGFGLGGSQNGFSISVSASQNSANANGSSVTHHNSEVTAGNNLSVSSGQDVVLQGANLSGKHVDVDAGRNLLIRSEQDSASFKSQQSSSGANVSICVPPICAGSVVEGSANMSGSNLYNDFASVQQQSGIVAGEGGYDIYVGNHTQLDGAIIGSAASADKNHLSTGTLGWTDIDNHANSGGNGYGFSVSGSYGNTASGDKDKTQQSSTANGKNKEDSKDPTSDRNSLPVASLQQNKDSASSSTFSAISPGTIEIRNPDAQKQDVSQISRDTASAENALKDKFDAEKLQSSLDVQREMTVLGQQVIETSYEKLKAQRKKEAQKELENDPTYKGKTDAEKQQAIADSDKKVEAQYGVGSLNQSAAQAVVGLFSALAGGNVSGSVAAGASPLVAQLVKYASDHSAGGEPMRVLLHTLVSGLIAKAQGGSVAGGAAGGFTAAMLGHNDELSKFIFGKTINELTEDQKELLANLGTLAGAVSGAAVDGSNGAGSGAVTGRTEVENNLLGGTEDGQAKFVQEHGNNILSCSTDPSSASCQKGLAMQDALMVALPAGLGGGVLAAATPEIAALAKGALQTCTSYFAICLNNIGIQVSEIAVPGGVGAGGAIGIGKTAAQATAARGEALAANAAHNAAKYAGLKLDLKTTESANEVVDSLRNTGKLPDIYVNKAQAIQNGWKAGKALNNTSPGKQIGGDIFDNSNDLLPSSSGRIWREADIGLDNTMSRSNQAGTRLLYSDDGLLYITTDHYKTATSIGKWK